VDHGLSRSDDAGWGTSLPDGPPPSREQLPLPRRQRQSHLAPQLRVADGAEPGTPFVAFAKPSSMEPDADQSGSDAPQASGLFGRAAAFYAGARRARRRSAESA
jgi:hypothetical protein